jgi:CRP/FNR family transcriptional regulator, cyclic AMP receptor protein
MASGEETVELLARTPMFRELSRKDLEQLAQVAVPRSYGRSQVIFRQGDHGDTCYVVRSGSVRVTHDHTDGRTITLAELRPGDMFGELAMFNSEVRSATVQALEDSSALALLAGDMRRMLLSHPHIAVNMLSWMSDRLRAANDRIARQSFQTVASRVAGALLAQVQARSSNDSPEPPREGVIRATQAEIAQLAGASRESASRFLARLERDGVVTTGRGKVLVHEPSALRNYIY